MLRVTVGCQRRYAKILLGSLLVVFLFGAASYLFLARELKELAGQVAANREKIALVNSRDWPGLLAGKEGELAELLAEFSSLNDPVGLLVSLEELALAAGVAVTSFSYQDHPVVTALAARI